jgi:orotidine-5'-phosphate decarboxylase
MPAPLLVALDVPTAAEADRHAANLAGVVGGLKIGSTLFTGAGPDLVRRYVAQGHRVFLDLKFHDIPHQVSGAVASAAALGTWMLTIHTGGGRDMMRAAADSAREAAAKSGAIAPLIIGVTVLTSLDQPALEAVGVDRRLADHVERLAVLARESGIDGVVCSPQEAARLRGLCGPEFLLVTPGIRSRAGSGPSQVRTDDQARTLTAAEAIAAGANYLVVGRPILGAPDPRAAAVALATEIASA